MTHDRAMIHAVRLPRVLINYHRSIRCKCIWPRVDQILSFDRKQTIPLSKHNTRQDRGSTCGPLSTLRAPLKTLHTNKQRVKNSFANDTLDPDICITFRHPTRSYFDSTACVCWFSQIYWRVTQFGFNVLLSETTRCRP